MDDDKMNKKVVFARRLKQSREFLCLTQEALAGDPDFSKFKPSRGQEPLSAQQISRWERGKSLPHVQTLTVIAEFFSVPTESLYNDLIYSDDHFRALLRKDRHDPNNKKTDQAFSNIKDIIQQTLIEVSQNSSVIRSVSGLSQSEPCYFEDFIDILSREHDLLGIRKTLLDFGREIGFPRVAYTSLIPAKDMNIYYVVLNNFHCEYVNEYITGNYSIACPGILHAFQKNTPLLFSSVFNEHFLNSLDKRPPEAKEMALFWQRCQLDGLGFVLHLKGKHGEKTLFSFFQEHFDKKTAELINTRLPLASAMMTFFHEKVMGLINSKTLVNTAMSIVELAGSSGLLSPSPILELGLMETNLSHYQCGTGKLYDSHPLIPLMRKL